MFAKKKSDLSAAITYKFILDEVCSLGLLGCVTAVSYDVVQSLMAVGLDNGTVHVFGQGGVRVKLQPKKTAPVKYLRFVKSVYLVSIDESAHVVVWALDTQQEWAHYKANSTVTSLYTDPAMDWLFLGLEHGQVMSFDIDRGVISRFKLESLQDRLTGSSNRITPVQSVVLHPRNPSMLLIVYRKISCVFDIIESKIVFQMPYNSEIQQGTWHPSGSHIVTLHDDESLVFWDGQTGRFLSSRPGISLFKPASLPNEDSILFDATKKRFSKSLIIWACAKEPESTFLVTALETTVRVIHFGMTPRVAISTYDSMGKFFCGGTTFHIELPEPVKSIFPIPRDGPHFLGCHNPQYFLVLYESGNVNALNMCGGTDGHTPVLTHYDATILPPALAWRQAPRTSIELFAIPRHQWIGMMASVSDSMLKGGQAGPSGQRKLQLSTIIAVGYANGQIKLFDGSRIDARDSRVIAVSIAGILNNTKPDAVHVTHVSLAGAIGELAVGTLNGFVYLLSFRRNSPGMETLSLEDKPIQRISHCANPELKEGFMPQWLIRGSSRPTALRHSNVGFVGIGYEDGTIKVVDRRGPAFILEDKYDKKGHPTFIEFGISVVNDDTFSSILMAVGTSKGNVMLYRILPRSQGGYQMDRLFKVSVGSEPIIHLCFIDIENGMPCNAMPGIMAELANALKINGALLSVTSGQMRLTALTGQRLKLANKSFSTSILGASFSILKLGDGLAVAVINKKGKTAFYGLPGFGLLSTADTGVVPAAKAEVSINGDVFVPADENVDAAFVFNVFGTGNKPGKDEVYNPKIKVPARPTISTATWIQGQKFVKIEDVDKAVALHRRPKSKRATEQLVEDAPVPPASTKEKSSGKGLNIFGSRKKQLYAPPKGPPQKSWSRTIDEYYDSAETKLNGVVDEVLESMDFTKSANSSAIASSILKSKFGF